MQRIEKYSDICVAIHSPCCSFHVLFCFAVKYQANRFIDIDHRPPRLIAPGHDICVHPYAVVRSRGTSDWLLIYTLRGSGRYSHGADALRTEPGDITLYPPSTPHDYRIAENAKEWEMLWAHFIAWPHWQELLAWPQRFHGLRRVHVRDHARRRQIVSALLSMNAHAIGPLDEAELFAMNALEKALLLCKAFHADSAQTRLDARIGKALSFMCENASRRVRLDEIAREAALSPSRLSHLFHEQVGLTPLEYLEHQRIRQAKRLLELSAHNVTQIALATGFESQSYFTRRFTARTGVSPKKYRKDYMERSAAGRD
jgi:AraC family transcriptional regulator of arabinose operon